MDCLAAERRQQARFGCSACLCCRSIEAWGGWVKCKSIRACIVLSLLACPSCNGGGLQRRASERPSPETSPFACKAPKRGRPQLWIAPATPLGSRGQSDCLVHAVMARVRHVGPACWHCFADVAEDPSSRCSRLKSSIILRRRLFATHWLHKAQRRAHAIDPTHILNSQEGKGRANLPAAAA